jgi:surface polysaccharide O-acyltransferase-like enzyme
LILYGTSAHLWYLPYAFAASVVTMWLWTLLNRLHPTAATLLMWMVSMAVLITCSVLFPVAGKLPAPLPQYFISLPAIPLGLAMAVSWKHAPHRPDVRRRLAYAAMFAFIASVCVAATYAPPTSSIAGYTSRRSDKHLLVIKRYSIGTILFCLALLWQHGLPPMLTTFSSRALGVYLVHPLVSMVLIRFQPVAPGTAGHAVLLIITSIAAALALSRTPVNRFI